MPIDEARATFDAAFAGITKDIQPDEDVQTRMSAAHPYLRTQVDRQEHRRRDHAQRSANEDLQSQGRDRDYARRTLHP